MKKILQIENLQASIGETTILNGVNMTINTGEVHVIMGQNGAGKSTLASVLMGHPFYEVTAGEVQLEEKKLLEMSVDERARAGLFLAMQYPSEISGVTNVQLLRQAINARREEGNKIKLLEFYRSVERIAAKLQMSEDYASREVNVGFSGGEKKRNEIFQMMLLHPKLAILDEIDSGLDIDAIKIVGEALQEYLEKRKDEMGLLIITHYPRLLSYIKADYVHIMQDGKIIETGGHELAHRLEQEGYDGVLSKKAFV